MKLETIKSTLAGNLWAHGRIQAVRRALALKNSLILEIGSGEGNYISNIFRESNRIIYSDRDWSLLKNVTGIRICLDAQRLPFQAASLDNLICADVLEHVRDDKGALKEFGRILKSGGRLLLILPAYATLYSNHQIKLGHFRRYDKGMTVRLLEDGGFLVDAIRYAGFWHLCAMRVIQALHVDETRFYGKKLPPASRPPYRWYGQGVLSFLVWCDRFFNKVCGISMILICRKR